MKFIEFTTTTGQRTLINRDWITFVRDMKQAYTTIYLGVGSKNFGPFPISVMGSYDTVVKKINEE